MGILGQNDKMIFFENLANLGQNDIFQKSLESGQNDKMTFSGNCPILEQDDIFWNLGQNVIILSQIRFWTNAARDIARRSDMVLIYPYG